MIWHIVIFRLVLRIRVTKIMKCPKPIITGDENSISICRYYQLLEVIFKKQKFNRSIIFSAFIKFILRPKLTAKIHILLVIYDQNCYYIPLKLFNDNLNQKWRAKYLFWSQYKFYKRRGKIEMEFFLLNFFEKFAIPEN